MVREPTSSEIRSRNKLVEPEQERSMDRSSILRASTRINKRRSFERRFLWMSVRVGRLEGLAKEASDVRFRAFKKACARLIAVSRAFWIPLFACVPMRFAVCAIGFIMKMAIAW